MNRLSTILTAAALAAAVGQVHGEETSVASMAYGIRVYSAHAESGRLVSFPVDNPSEEEELLDLSEYNIMAATCHDNVYYLIHSDDGILASKFLTLDLNTMTIRVVKNYDWKFDLAGNIIYSDLTFDATSGAIYAAGYNLEDADVEDGEPTAPFGIFTIDPATGDATLVGQQEEHALVSIMTDAEGTLMGVDERGVLWDVSRWGGYLNYEMLDLGVTPAGLQSMAHDFGKGVSYWASYTADAAGNGVSQLIRFERTPDWTYVKESVGAIGTDSEIIGLYIDSNPLPKGAPSVVEGFAVTAGEQGAATATLSWTNPSKTAGGDELGQIDIIIYRDDTPVTTLEGLESGKEQTWTDSDVPCGNHTYSIAASNDVAEGRQTYAPELWIGEDVPGAPAVSATASADGKTITVSWTAPESGLHGGWHDASQVTYSVKRCPDGKIVLENSTMTGLTDEGIDEMHGYYYEVTASTPAGTGGTGKSLPAVAGNPHQTPFSANFNDNDQVNQWKTFNVDGDDYSWYLHTTGWAGTYDAFFRYNPENILNPETETDDWLISPPVALEKGKLYVVKYDLRLLGTLFPANTTLALGKAQTPEEMNIILSETDGEINDIEWITHAEPFTVEESGAYCFGYQTRNAVPVQFYKFAVEEVEATDLSAGSLHGNTLANVGTESTYQVEVTNRGFNTTENFSVELVDAEGNTLVSCDYTVSIPSQMTRTLDVIWTPEKEGVTEIRPRVVAEGDSNSDNDLGTGIQVTVFGSGEMVHIKDGKTGTGYAPFYGSYLHSAVQTIYPAENLADHTDVDIKAIIYYIYTAMGSTPSNIDFEVALACVDKEDFADNTMIGEEDLAQVYEGTLQIDPANKTVAILLDTPFHYTGGNLCVFTRHDSESMTPVYFEAAYSSSDPLFHTCLYRGSDRFDFTQTPNGSYHDLPNVSFLVSPHSGRPEIASESGIGIRYTRGEGVTIEGDYDTCRIYSASGLLLAECSGDKTVAVPASADGILIVEVISGNECVVRKIAAAR
ncbi:MAG: fibronectin type III domain-containing protein [Muribaculaceae bacterium]|nr:fibronectin type III domain-containing protein [Muribaculaceae bacterium]